MIKMANTATVTAKLSKLAQLPRLRRGSNGTWCGIPDTAPILSPMKPGRAVSGACTAGDVATRPGGDMRGGDRAVARGVVNGQNRPVESDRSDPSSRREDE